ncbi:MAG TPA: DegV family protein [Solirubrobacteraceae bacterium]|nr:DegV family protein [Solirubrobacteraceae bacterium]
MAVAVVSDSTHYVPRGIVERHGIHTVSLYVTWNGRTDREAEMEDFGRFYDNLARATALPVTSQPSVGDFLAVYEPLLARGDDIVSIHLSGGISGTVRAAEQARAQVLERGVDPARIAIVDSATGCAGHGLMAIAAANAAAAGAGVAEAAARARELRARMQILFAVDTLEYLRRGGRIGGAQAWIGSTLRIKPILSIDSEILPVERVRTSGRAFGRLVEHLETLHADGGDVFFIQHIRAPEQADRLADRGRELFGRDPEFVSEIGPVIGAHVGPGLLGVTALQSRLLGPV